MMMEKKIDPTHHHARHFYSQSSQRNAAATAQLSEYDPYPSSRKSLVVHFIVFFIKFYCFMNPSNGTGSINKVGLGKRKNLKQAGRELELDEKEFSYDQALGQIGLWKNSLIFPDEVKTTDDWLKSCQFLYKKYEEYKAENWIL